MNRPLFRPEALAARQGGWLGPVRLIRPLSLDLVTVGVLAVALALGGFLWAAQYTRKATMDGTLAPDRGVIRLVAADVATVVERTAVEGQSVRAGDSLFVLALERPRLLAPAQAEVRRSLAERQSSLQETALQQQGLAASQRVAIEGRLQAVAAEGLQLEREHQLLRQRLDLSQQALKRLQVLRDEHFISDAQVLVKEEERLALLGQLQALDRQRTVLARERLNLQAESRNLPLQSRNTQGEIARDLAALTREAAEQDGERRLVVRAPQDGVLSAVLAEAGQAVSPASALASLVPAGAQLQAQLYAPSRALGFVRPGQVVRLRLEAYPYQKFGQLEGTVVQVSRTPLAAADLAAQPMAAGLGRAAGGPDGEALFRVTVALKGSPVRDWPQPLVAGMRLQADVLLDRRRLVEWLFEPLLGLQRRL